MLSKKAALSPAFMRFCETLEFTITFNYYIAIKQKDDYVTKLSQFNCQRKPKASVLILHGMAEHQKRYSDFINFLNVHDIDVYIYDHRGHGVNNKITDLGFISHSKGHQIVLNDAITISQYIEKNNRSNKFFLFGHSMGSIIARNIIQSKYNYNGVILSGTTFPPKSVLTFGLIITSIVKKINGPKHISPLLNNLIFGSKNFTNLSNRTVFDWLTRNNQIVGSYINDPYCGFTCTASFYNDLLKLTYHASKKKLICQTKRELPIYLISGEADPVSNNGKEIKKYHRLLKKSGFSNVSMKLYPDCRHELLNELINDEVYIDILHWISKRI